MATIPMRKVRSGLPPRKQPSASAPGPKASKGQADAKPSPPSVTPGRVRLRSEAESRFNGDQRPDPLESRRRHDFARQQVVNTLERAINRSRVDDAPRMALADARELVQLLLRRCVEIDERSWLKVLALRPSASYLLSKAPPAARRL